MTTAGRVRFVVIGENADATRNCGGPEAARDMVGQVVSQCRAVNGVRSPMRIRFRTL